MSTTSQSTYLSMVHGCWRTERFKTTGDSMHLQATCVTFVFKDKHWEWCLKPYRSELFLFTYFKWNKNLVILHTIRKIYRQIYRMTIKSGVDIFEMSMWLAATKMFCFPWGEGIEKTIRLTLGVSSSSVLHMNELAFCLQHIHTLGTNT